MSPTTTPRILVTRALEDAQGWAEQIEHRGGEAVVYPCIACRSLLTPALASALSDSLQRADWLAVTSRRGVQAIAELLAAGTAALGTTRVCAVGPATAEAARALLGRIDLEAADGTATSLAEALVRRSVEPPDAERATVRVVLAVADRAATTLEEALTRRGSEASRFEVYATVPAPARAPKDDLAELDLDAIFVASPSAVQGLAARADVPPGLPIVSIGPTTSAAARNAGFRSVTESATRDLSGMLDAMRTAIQRRHSRLAEETSQ